MPVCPPAIATDPAGTAVRGLERRGTAFCQVGKAWNEPDRKHSVDPARVQRDDLFLGATTESPDVREVWTELASVADGDIEQIPFDDVSVGQAGSGSVNLLLEPAGIDEERVVVDGNRAVTNHGIANRAAVLRRQRPRERNAAGIHLGVDPWGELDEESGITGASDSFGAHFLTGGLRPAGPPIAVACGAPTPRSAPARRAFGAPGRLISEPIQASRSEQHDGD
jgi:hypothetical protein